MKCPALPRSAKTGAVRTPASCPRNLGFRVAVPTGTAPLLSKDRSEQSFALGLFLSVGALDCGCHLARLLAASAADDLV